MLFDAPNFALETVQILSGDIPVAMNNEG
jgi:hypothetical protein